MNSVLSLDCLPRQSSVGHGRDLNIRVTLEHRVMNSQKSMIFQARVSLARGNI
jgi:hypothetical protein